MSVSKLKEGKEGIKVLFKVSEGSGFLVLLFEFFLFIDIFLVLFNNLLVGGYVVCVILFNPTIIEDVPVVRIEINIIILS